MSRKDLYRQERCARCNGYFYNDQMRRDSSGRFVCDSCRIRRLFLKRRGPKVLDVPMPFGVSLLEVLVVVVILGAIAGITVPTILHVRQRVLETELRNLFYDYQGTNLLVTALDSLDVIGQGQSLQDIPGFAGTDDQELDELQDELRRCLDRGNEELRVGAAIKAITEWQERQGSGSP